MTRRDEVLALLPDDVDGIVLESAGVVSWYLGGARVSVPLGGPSVVAVLVARSGDEVRCPVMELARLREEEGVEDAVAVPWHEPVVPDAWRRNRRHLAEVELEGPLRAARATLDDTEVARYRALGLEVAQAVTSVARTLGPAHSERDVAGLLAARVLALGAEPVVLLVAGRSRLGHRHPLPTSSSLGDRAMLVVGARRHGLIVNLTRWVGSPDPLEQSLLAVEAAVLDATTPGAGLAEAFAALQGAYPANGFAADEWRNHHQGGPTGYFGRDPKVTPSSGGVIAEHQAFAWNPSAPGLKAEDTVLATSAGIELLTHDPVWPTVSVAGRPRPTTLRMEHA
jgi:Xaa-Pro aminopeptidase